MSHPTVSAAPAPTLSRAHAHPHDHDHGHAHNPELIRPPGFSLLRASLALRLAGAAGLTALVWAVIWIAMR